MARKRNTSTPALTDVQKREKRRENFTRVLPKRMDKALKAIRMVGDCTLPTYLYTPEQAQAVMNSLHLEVSTVEERFAGVQGKGSGFKLPS